MSLVPKATKYTHVFVIVGDNDALYKSMHYICRKYKEFRDAIWPTKVMFAGHMRRKDLPVELVSKNNMFFRNQLGYLLKSTKVIRREDFSNNCPFHFDKFGEGYRHMAVLVLSDFRDFCNNE